MDNKEIIIGALRQANKEDAINKIFKDYNVDSYNDKIDYLKKAMYNPQTFFSSGEDIEDKKKYEILLEAFLLGKWKLYELYKQAGLVKNENK